MGFWVNSVVELNLISSVGHSYIPFDYNNVFLFIYKSSGGLRGYLNFSFYGTNCDSLMTILLKKQ